MTTERCPHCNGDLSAAPIMFVAALGEVRVGGKTAKLRPTEMDIFELLYEAMPRVVAKDHIVAEIWRNASDAEMPGPDIVNVYISKIRRAFRDAGIESVSINSTEGRNERAGFVLSFHPSRYNGRPNNFLKTA